MEVMDATDQALAALAQQLQPGLEQTFARCREHFGPSLGMGRHRVVFSDGEHVVKVPINVEGMLVNHQEAHWSGSFPLAPAQLEAGPCGIALLRMQRVREVPWRPGESRPFAGTWVDDVDAAQVGYLPDGQLVAFDGGDAVFNDHEAVVAMLAADVS